MKALDGLLIRLARHLMNNAVFVSEVRASERIRKQKADMADNEKIAKAVELMASNIYGKAPFGIGLPDFLNASTSKNPRVAVSEWAQQEASLVMRRIEACRNASVRFEESSIVVEFPREMPTASVPAASENRDENAA